MASAELERDLVCGSRSESPGVAVTVGVLEEARAPVTATCSPLSYRTMIISTTLAEIARKCLSLLGGSLFWVEDKQLRASQKRVACHTLGSCLVGLDESPNHADVSPVWMHQQEDKSGGIEH